MAWYIIQSERKTWTKYVVQAEDEKSAIDACDEWEYIGFIDGDDTSSIVIGGPFKKNEDLSNDILSFVEN
jgi:hypothetical protein